MCIGWQYGASGGGVLRLCWERFATSNGTNVSAAVLVLVLVVVAVGLVLCRANE